MTERQRRAGLAFALAGIGLLICQALPAPASAQTAPPDRRFGAIEAFRDPVAAAEVGVGWDRILLYWSELQPNGPDDWNLYHVPNEWLDLAAQADREIVGLIKNTPQWATDGSAGCGVPRGLYLPIDDPGNLWANFVRLVVAKYQGRIDHWIIWNEPDIAPTSYGAEWCGSVEDYYQLLKVAYLAAHEVNSNVTIHLGGLTYWHDKQYLRKLLAVATKDPSAAQNGYYFDVVSLHIYFTTETVPEIFAATHSALSAYGIHKPIWLNETNAATNSDPQWDYPDANYQIDPDEQASFLMQSFALALSQGAERIAVYKWRDQDFPAGGNEPNGIIRPDYSRLPAVDAFRTIVTYYAGTASARENRQPLYTIVTLNRGSRTTRVLWTRTKQEVTVSLPSLAPQALLVEQTGAQSQVSPVDGKYTITLPAAPCTDKRGCIIGGRTYLLVEESTGAAPAAPTEPPETESSPTSQVTALPTLTPILTATAQPTPTLTSTPTVTPSATPQPSATPSPEPSATPTRTPSPTPSASATAVPPAPTPTPSTASTFRPPWPLLGIAGAALLAVIIGTVFRRRP